MALIRQASLARARPQTESADASHRALAQADMVLPVVTTSSMSSTASPSTLAVASKVPSAISIRAAIDPRCTWGGESTTRLSTSFPEGMPVNFAKLACQKRRLIVAAASFPAGVHGHGYDEGRGDEGALQPTGKDVCKLRREGAIVSILEGVDGGADGALEGVGGADADDGQRRR